MRLNFYKFEVNRKYQIFCGNSKFPLSWGDNAGVKELGGYEVFGDCLLWYFYGSLEATHYPQKLSPLCPAYLNVLNSFPPHFAPLCDSVPCRTVYSMLLIIVVTRCLTVTNSCFTFLLYTLNRDRLFCPRTSPQNVFPFCLSSTDNMSSSSSLSLPNSYITGPSPKLNVLFLYYNCCCAFC